ncbi:MAG: cytochrome c [bacterium]|nr:cytochrome c [bacterium]
MKTRSLNLLLLAGLVVAAAFNWVATSNRSEPNTEFLPEMVRSVPFNSFSGNLNFPDGKTLRQPVKGTIPRGFTPIHYDATPEDALRAADKLANPYVADDKEAVKRGESVFTSFCRHCHGAGGRGDGAVVLRGYPGPPSFFAEEPLARKDGQMFHIISYGQGKMPAHASQISREDRWKVISYIRTLQSKSQ